MAAGAKKHGVAGNRNSEKFKTPAKRQEVFKLYCEHLAAGYSPKTFHNPCVENTVLKMIKDYPQEFDIEEFERAKAQGHFTWETMGKLGTMGKLKGFNASSWWRIMQNKMGWKDGVQLSGDKENPLNPNTGKGALSPAEQAVLDHFKEKMLYEINHQGGMKKGQSDKK